MAKRPIVDQPAVREVEDIAWKIKDTFADLHGRVLANTDLGAIAGMKRDLERVLERALQLRDKHKLARQRRAETRAPEPPPAAPAGDDAQPSLLPEGT